MKMVLMFAVLLFAVLVEGNGHDGPKRNLCELRRFNLPICASPVKYDPGSCPTFGGVITQCRQFSVKQAKRFCKRRGKLYRCQGRLNI